MQISAAVRSYVYSFCREAAAAQSKREREGLLSAAAHDLLGTHCDADIQASIWQPSEHLRHQQTMLLDQQQRCRASADDIASALYSSCFAELAQTLLAGELASQHPYLQHTALSADWLHPTQTLLLTGALHLVKLQPSATCSSFSTGPQLTLYYHPLSCKHQACCVLKRLCLLNKPAAGLHRPWVLLQCTKTLAQSADVCPHVAAPRHLCDGCRVLSSVVPEEEAPLAGDLLRPHVQAAGADTAARTLAQRFAAPGSSGTAQLANHFAEQLQQRLKVSMCRSSTILALVCCMTLGLCQGIHLTPTVCQISMQRSEAAGSASARPC